MRNTEQNSRQLCCYSIDGPLSWSQFCSLFENAPMQLESLYNARLVKNESCHIILDDDEIKLVINNEMIQVDLVHSLAQKREILRTEGLNKQLLYKALKLKGDQPKVWDTTAGLGEDTCWFIAMGAHVIASERNPFLYTLLYSQFEKLKKLGEPVSLEWGSAPDLFDKVDLKKAHAIYYDPFYQKKRKAKAKKSMELIGKAFHNNDLDAHDIAQQLFEACNSRLIIKRADKAPGLISSMKPTYEIKGKTIRFDIYYRG